MTVNLNTMTRDLKLEWTESESNYVATVGVDFAVSALEKLFTKEGIKITVKTDMAGGKRCVSIDASKFNSCLIEATEKMKANIIQKSKESEKEPDIMKNYYEAIEIFDKYQVGDIKLTKEQYDHYEKCLEAGYMFAHEKLSLHAQGKIKLHPKVWLQYLEIRGGGAAESIP